MELPPSSRRVYCNRTLNLRAIRAIGYDMDYTLIHYRVDEWERRAYEYIRERLLADGWPVADLRFDPDLVVRGLVLDLEHGDALKVNRFGYVKGASHGSRMLGFEAQRRRYARTLVDLSEPRWVFLNTLFQMSEGCLYLQLVDLLDAGKLPAPLGYIELYQRVSEAMGEAHAEGAIKDEIAADPGRFVVLDPEMPQALLDQKRAGKRLLLVTNSEWSYTQAMLAYAMDPFLPGEMTWRELFDVKIVAALKPAFFTQSMPLFEVVDEQGLLRPAGRSLAAGGAYLGGCAPLVEDHLGLSGEEILYVGDHIYADVHVTKSVLRWRTALVLRELEGELEALAAFAPQEARLQELMQDKERLEHAHATWRMRRERGEDVGDAVERSWEQLRELDARIQPLAKASAELGSVRWGPLMRAGNDKSLLARMVERHADVYTSRVSNLLQVTPFAYLRSRRGSLPHDPAT